MQVYKRTNEEVLNAYFWNDLSGKARKAAKNHSKNMIVKKYGEQYKSKSFVELYDSSLLFSHEINLMRFNQYGQVICLNRSELLNDGWKLEDK